MLHSLYNIVTPIDEDKSVLFNSFSRKFIVISSRFVNQYLEIINKPDEYIKLREYVRFINELRLGGFIIDDPEEQLLSVKKAQKTKDDESNFCLSIYTTLDCNYTCWYCVQDHQKIVLGPEMQNRIIKLIENKCADNNIKKVRISWFGGEPFLNFDAITRISKAIVAICYKCGIEYSCDFTTNASLINEETIEKISHFNVSSFQITIDGSRICHNKTKFNLTENNAFDTSLKSIVLLTSRLPKSNIFVRINYTNNNLLDSFVDEIDEYLNQVKDKIYIFFRKVWQIKETHRTRQKNREIMLKLKNRGYNIVHDFDHLGLLSCISEQKSYNSIFPIGVISRCANVGIDKAEGRLLSNGTIKVNQNDMNIPPVSEQCNNCKYFPICLGPCPRARKRYQADNISLCKFDDESADEYFKNEILNYYYLNSEP